MELAHIIHLSADTMWFPVREIQDWINLIIELLVKVRDYEVCKVHCTSKTWQEAVVSDDIVAMEPLYLGGCDFLVIADKMSGFDLCDTIRRKYVRCWGAGSSGLAYLPALLSPA